MFASIGSRRTALAILIIEITASAAAAQATDRAHHRIPNLLPGAAATPQLPLFLRQLTWVDLRDGLDKARVDRLEWGITGVKPRRA